MTLCGKGGHSRPLGKSGRLRPLRKSGHLRPLEWLRVAASGCFLWDWNTSATRRRRPLAVTCGHSSGCEWLQVAAFLKFKYRAECNPNEFHYAIIFQVLYMPSGCLEFLPSTVSSWWFQPLWKILVKLIGVKIKKIETTTQVLVTTHDVSCLQECLDERVHSLSLNRHGFGASLGSTVEKNSEKWKSMRDSY